MLKKVFWFGLVFMANAQALQFVKTQWQNEPAILATGKILAGDAERLENILQNMSQASHGKYMILLDSLGGSVGAALDISDLFSHYPIHTIIPKNARCASACASVVFIAGDYRTVEEGGLFGQHSCSLAGERYEKCNEILAQHAVQHGVAYGNVKAFVNYFDPSTMSWLTREDVDGWNISHYPFSKESHFNGEPPPHFLEILGQDPAPISNAWRVDFADGGAKAFVRLITNYQKAGEVVLFCRENHLFLGFYLPGKVQEIRAEIDFAMVDAPPCQINSSTRKNFSS